ncbi:MAG: globin domain-containing protein [Pseudomonadota bacterium]|nr:globin domain-containing protein [Pseudomonadota bacterium]
MTPTQIMLVKNSFQAAAPQRRRLAPIFFSELFAREPSLRALFSGDVSAHGTALFQGLSAIVGSLARLHPIMPALEWLALRNARRGLREYHYEAFGEALLAALEQGLGEAFTADTRQAWTAAHAKVARLMLDSLPAEALAA